MCRARFSIVRIKRCHEAAGLIAEDLIRGIEHWLVDEGLESSVPDGCVLATRLYAPDRFSMTTGVNIPLGFQLMQDVIDEMPRFARKPLKEAIDDRRFAEGIYRIALASGVMAQVFHQEVPAETANP
jgi:hypothetical protein